MHGRSDIDGLVLIGISGASKADCVGVLIRTLCVLPSLFSGSAHLIILTIKLAVGALSCSTNIRTTTFFLNQQKIGRIFV